MGKITRFPGSKERRARLNLNARRVPCQVSNVGSNFQSKPPRCPTAHTLPLML